MKKRLILWNENNDRRSITSHLAHRVTPAWFQIS